MTSSLIGRCRALAARFLEDLETIVDRDPSVHTRSEALLHPCTTALLGHRAGAVLYRRRMFRCARAVCALVKIVTGGIEIHSGARIGRRFFVDHGSGVVIGETAVIGDDVTLFHQVTLGSTGWWNDGVARRHPVLGNGVTVGANATILGPVTVGDHAVVGAMSLVVRDVPCRAHVRAPIAEVRMPRSRSAGTGAVVGFPP